MQLDPVRVRRALAPAPLPSAAAVGDHLVALHATDPTTTLLSAWARLPAGTVSDALGGLTSALEADRSLVRVLAMRRTLHVVPVALLPAMLAVYADRLAPAQAKRAEELLEAGGARARFPDVAERILAALDDGEATTTELAAKVPELGLKALFNEGKTYAGTGGIGGRIMDAVGVTGRAVRARSRGGWKTSLCTWSRIERWLPDLPDRPAPAEGRAVVVRAYLRAFGPATLDDAAWWTGLPKGQVKQALGADVVEVTVRGWPGTRLVLRERLDDLQQDRPEAGITFLPALDPLLMAWTDRAPVMDPAHREVLFDRSGNIGATVLADGQVIGGWAMPKDGRVLFRLLERPELKDAVQVEAERLRAALRGERVAPRFPVPLGKELAG